MKKLLILFLFSNLLFSEVSKKIIYYGWGTRDTMYIRENWEKMEEMPLDGIGINICIDRKKGPVDTGNILGWHLFSKREFKYDNFKEAVEDLKIPKWKKFKDNFLPACICSTAQDQNFNWFDEERWRIIKNNWKTYIRIAKEGNLKGIIIDPEHYGAYFFHYPTMRERVNRPFEEYKMKVYERGKELMKITKEIYPDITILFFWTHSYLVLHPSEKLKEPEINSYGLLPYFVDGFIDESDERMRIFDICEFAYGFKEKIQFLESYHSIINKASKFSINPEKYRKKIKVGFGLWIDNGNKWNNEDFSKNYFKPEEFQKSLEYALEISDEYVWIYSQQVKFFPPNLPEEYLKAIKKVKKEE
ncbi:MAG: hypothetical protein NC926_02930 [Candidatus Omnitrophica bacterium]|nr:hypothetical protein [Candidatus Omnitrophota bacterium]